ncbi:MAG: twin-arginine translocase TatA/TatE family subunit [Waddliaceae bacterium]
MFGLGIGELILIFIIVILLFGATRLPEIAKSMGKAILEFKKAGKEIQKDIEESTDSINDEEKK